MAWYTIEYACGHTEEKQLYGKIAERERYIDNCKNRECPDCRKKALHAKALEHAEAESLPELEGSEKQIAWAIDLRYVRIFNIEKMLPEVWDFAKKIGKSEEEITVLKGNYDVCINNLKSKTSAKFWIDERDEEFFTIQGLAQYLHKFKTL